MRNNRGKFFALAGGLLLGGSAVALAAGFTTNGLPVAGGSQYPSTIPLTGNEQAAFDTGLAGGLQPQTEAITVGQLAVGAAPQASPRNYLDNGALQIAQQGTGIITGGTTTITALQFAGDRWFVDTNVTSGAGRGQITTTVPTPPAGFTQSMRLYRTSGALLQPVCALQEIETSRATQLAGKSVVLSAYVQALAAMTGTGTVNAYLLTGTGTDQGLGTLTASPAITPAWTGIAGGTTPVASWVVPTSSPSWSRYNSLAVVVPAGTTEAGVAICFTPGATGAGTTDGFAFTGVQLEAVTGTGTNPGPSSYEFRLVGEELRAAQRFAVQLNEPANGAAVSGFCQATGATANTCTLALPVTMRGTTPTIAIGTAGTFKVNIAGTPTTFASPTAGVCSVTSCTVTGGNTNTAGQAETLTGGGGSGIWTISNDVVM